MGRRARDSNKNQRLEDSKRVWNLDSNLQGADSGIKIRDEDSPNLAKILKIAKNAMSQV